jgi:hypothetical protein
MTTFNEIVISTSPPIINANIEHRNSVGRRYGRRGHDKCLAGSRSVEDIFIDCAATLNKVGGSPAGSP